MNVPSRLALFAVLLAVVFGGAVLVGSTLDPTDEPVASVEHAEESTTGSDEHGSEPMPMPQPDHGGQAESGSAHESPSGTSVGPAAPAAPGHATHADAAATVRGLAVTQDGYSLDFDRTQFAASRSAPLRFQIRDEHGRTVRDGFQVEHEKRLHMIVVRRDTNVFRHVHPRQQRDGTWQVDVDLHDPGVYRAYADFKIDDDQHTLATDLFVPGEFDPAPLPAPRGSDRAVDDDGSSADKIDVTLDAAGIRAGRDAQLTFAASGDGRPLTTLQPFLGAKGHLVALREGDLAYLHVHPTEGDDHAADNDSASTHDTSADHHANETTFATTFPTAGRYRLFLQFKVDGRVRTVDYTVEVPR